VFCFEAHPNVILIPSTFEFLRNTLHMWDAHRTQRLFLFIWTTHTLGINNRVNGTFGTTVELKIASQATNFIKQILFLAYDGSSIVKILN
jgi:hypothetical protein